MSGRRGAWTAAIIAAAISLAMATPFVWMLGTSLKTSAEVFREPATWWPESARWANYRDVWDAAPFGRFFLNSIVSSLAGAALQVGVAFTMAYAFVRIRVPGRGIVFAAVVGAMLLPEELKLIPNYLLVDRLDWIDSYWALIVPPAAHAFPVLVLTVQLRTVPRELFDAAAIDGAGHWRALISVAAPKCSAMLAALFLIAFLGRWNDYLWPLLVTNSETMRTLPVGIAYLRGSLEGGVRWEWLMAASVLSTAPIIFMFLVLQNRFGAGILAGFSKD